MDKKIISCLLSCVLFFSCISNMVANVISFASSESTSSSEYYSCTLQDLHEDSVYTTLSDVAPQITVFTYGCGGKLSNRKVLQ